MYIKNEDFGYLKSLLNTLDEERKKKLMQTLLKSGSERAGEEVKTITVVDKGIFDAQGVERNEFITRTMLKKVFKQVKEGK